METREQLVAFITENDRTAARIFAKERFPLPGQLLGVRLNLNVLKNTGVAVQTLHQGTNRSEYKENKGFFRGEVIGYAKTVWLRNAYFNVEQLARDDIANERETKSAMASVDGTLYSVDDVIPAGGLALRFNPRDVHLFVDTDNHAVHFAELVVIQGHRAYAFGRIIYHSESSAPKKEGSAPSAVTFMPQEKNILLPDIFCCD